VRITPYPAGDWQGVVITRLQTRFDSRGVPCWGRCAEPDVLNAGYYLRQG
jgi:hypothetical protein